MAADPTINVAKNGSEYATFNVFTNIYGQRRDGSQFERTEMHSVSAFNMIGYIKNRVHKGFVFLQTYLFYYFF